MIYDTLTLWTHNNNIWHSLSEVMHRELSMGVLQQHEVAKMIAWANSHRMTIIDNR